jgi:hypothetical protein
MTQKDCWIYLTRLHDNKPWKQCCCICKFHSELSDGKFQCKIVFGDGDVYFSKYNSEHGLCEMFTQKD